MQVGKSGDQVYLKERWGWGHSPSSEGPGLPRNSESDVELAGTRLTQAKNVLRILGENLSISLHGTAFST